MPEKVLILYGWHGSPAPHWQDWLARELASRGYIVAFLQLSDPMQPQKSIWLQEAKAVMDDLRPDTVIAHSLGNILWWHLCNEEDLAPVKRLLMVAPPRDLGDIKELQSFFPVALPKNLKAGCALMVVSDDDPYLNKSESLRFARALGVKQKLFQSMGHINADSGFGPWPWVLAWVEGGECDDIEH